MGSSAGDSSRPEAGSTRLPDSAVRRAILIRFVTATRMILGPNPMSSWGQFGLTAVSMRFSENRVSPVELRSTGDTLFSGGFAMTALDISRKDGIGHTASLCDRYHLSGSLHQDAFIRC